MTDFDKCDRGVIVHKMCKTEKNCKSGKMDVHPNWLIKTCFYKLGSFQGFQRTLLEPLVCHSHI